ncbi:inositol-3,4-bisphosphate 4-phosphatase [Achlya hypogyna]|uniref:Inositol-3,4-bisphosphate 4-phosphatase n=1 Tax=Achlya hypogyna TaxID=1202772 RepID=A0A1V9YBC8_ACHHY|nr:inositol-3,4-bisphosphate 4-phosphatase [Achlya hypogyna]
MRTSLALLVLGWLHLGSGQVANDSAPSTIVAPTTTALPLVTVNPNVLLENYSLADSISADSPVCRYYDRPCVQLPAQTDLALPPSTRYTNFAPKVASGTFSSCKDPYSACVPTNLYAPNATVLANGSIHVTFAFIRSDVLQADVASALYFSLYLNNASFVESPIITIDGVPAPSACIFFFFNCSGNTTVITLPSTLTSSAATTVSYVSMLLRPYTDTALVSVQRSNKNDVKHPALVASMVLPKLPPTPIAQPTIASEESPAQLIMSFEVPPAAIAYKQTVLCINLRSSACQSTTPNVTYFNASASSLGIVNDGGWINQPVEIEIFNATELCVHLRWNDTNRVPFPRIGLVVNNTILRRDSVFMNLSTLTEMTFASNGSLLANSCVVAAPYAMPRTLNEQVPNNLWTVIATVVYVFALLAALVLVRMNGLGVTSTTVYTDIASISVLFILLFSVAIQFYWLSILSRMTTGSKMQEVAFVVAVLDEIRSAAVWSLLVSIAIHWLSAYHPKCRQVHMKSRIWGLWMLLMGGYVVLLIWHLTQNFPFLRCTYIDYLLNRNPSADLWISLLEPIEWWHSGEVACRSFAANFERTFLLLHAFHVVVLAVVFVLGLLLIRQGLGMTVDSMESSRVYNGALLYLVITVLSFVVFLGIQHGLNFYLYLHHDKINILVWLFLGEFCPTLIPCMGFLILQWNSKLFALGGQSSSLTTLTAPRQVAETADVEDLDWKSTIACGEFDDAVMDEETQQFEYLRMQRTNLSALHSSMSLAHQQSKSRLSSIDSNDTMVALCLQLYFPEATTSSTHTFVEVYQSTDGGLLDELNEDAPVRRSSLRAPGLFESLLDNAATRRRSAMPTSTQFNWIRRGFTETAGSNQYQFGFCTGFSSVLYVPIEKPSTLRFLVYEMDLDTPRVLAEYVCPMDHLLQSTNAIATLSPTERSQETLVLRPSSILQEEPDAVLSLSRRFSFFGGQRRTTKSRATSASGVSNILTVVNHPVLPVLKLKPTLVSGGDDQHHLVGTSAFGLHSSSSFCTAKHFQFGDDGGDDAAYDSVHVVEELLESVLPNEVARQYLEQTLLSRTAALHDAQADLKRFELLRAEKPNYSNIIDQIQGEADLQLIQQWLEQRATKRSEYCAFLGECIGLCHERSQNSIYFKKSVEKKESRLRFLPTNLHVQEFWVGPMQPLQSELGRRTSPEVQLFETVTVGAFAAHNCKFRQTIPTLQAQLEALATAAESGETEGSVPPPLVKQSSATRLQGDWREEQARLRDEVQWSLAVREDECHAQALAALVTSFCRHLEKAMMPSASLFPYLDQLYAVGYLFQVESLLSDHGKEKAMLQDFSAATAWLANVRFELDLCTKHPKQQKATSLHLHLADAAVPGVLSVRLSQSPQHSGFTVVVGIYCDASQVELQQRLAVGHRSIAVTPVFFTQGTETLANKSTLQKETVQDLINTTNIEVLRTYVERYVAFVPHKKEQVAFDLEHLAVLVQQAKAEYVKKKHPEILQVAARLTRCMDGGRVVSCKSAKDRTAMSVTLEQGWILQHFYHLDAMATRRAVATMRSYGVRMDCVEKNIGKRQYAFNSLQRSMLPEAYRCPEGTFGKGNAS